ENVYVRDGASVVGDIHSAGIVIEDGAYIKGGIDLSRPRTDRQESSEQWSTEAQSEIQELSHAVLTSCILLTSPMRPREAELRVPLLVELFGEGPSRPN